MKLPAPPEVGHLADHAQVEETENSKTTVTQSEIVNFPRLGAIRITAIEQIGEFPQMAFLGAKSRKVIFRSPITDPDGWLKPGYDDELAQPFLRLRIVRSLGFPSPLIAAVAVRPGGSDHLFLLVVFGEVNGKIARLNSKPIETNIQGGYYLGYLNQKLGYGLVSWDFKWDFDPSEPHEAHYDAHYYSMSAYSLYNGKFRKALSTTSKRKYHPSGSYLALRELGLNATDLRKTIPKMKEWVDVDD